MRSDRGIEKSKWPSAASFDALAGSMLLIFILLLSGCGEIGVPKSSPLIQQTAPPLKQEFRWSNGKMPKSFDPAVASAAPETDVVRALFEGLTDIDGKTLREVPAVAEKWASSEDFKTWTFYLRSDAKWSNGQAVTASDFVRSWTRLANMGTRVPHREMIYNIRGLRELEPNAVEVTPQPPDFVANSVPGANMPFPAATATQPAQSMDTGAGSERLAERPDAAANSNTNQSIGPLQKPKSTIGVLAEAENILVISLIRPDKDFPKLVASPMFRPTFDDIPPASDSMPNANIVTNGPFRLSGVGPEGVTLSRSEIYWNRETVDLQHVRFVPKPGAEKALEAYRNGELDAVTNADFEPLAMKLLSPYDDFRQTTHSALNFYEVNIKKAPFSDRRVRQALAIAIDREALTEGDMQSSTRPALSLLPFAKQPAGVLVQDRDLARELLEEAGFPDGLNFPVIRLVVNRNDVQQRIARSVAKMWKQNLNLDTEIIVKGAEDLEQVIATADYDLLRRGVVFPSNDETVSLMSIYGTEEMNHPAAAEKAGTAGMKNEKNISNVGKSDVSEHQEDLTIELTEAEALSELRAIPLYFPTSYSLVKPYIIGFEINSLDAPSLKDVSIDNSWQPK